MLSKEIGTEKEFLQGSFQMIVCRLNVSVIFQKEGVEFFLQEKTASKMRFCDPDWIRTNDPQLRRLMLYPAELPDQLFN